MGEHSRGKVHAFLEPVILEGDPLRDNTDGAAGGGKGSAYLGFGPTLA
jgi:hypothetical protein